MTRLSLSQRVAGVTPASQSGVTLGCNEFQTPTPNAGRMPATRLFALLLMVAFLLAACGSTSRVAEPGLLSPDTIEVMPVKNLTGVSLKVPEIYLGDNVRKAMQLEVENIDLKLLGEAAIFARLDDLGYRVALEDKQAFSDGPTSDGPTYEIHGAITVFDMSELRATGRFRMAIVVMVIDTATQTEVARGISEEEFQLLDMAPDEIGAIGEQRFIEHRLQIFTESLARDAVDAAGF